MARTRPVGQEPLGRPVGADRRVERLGQGLVEQVQVDHVEPELARAHVKPVECRVVTVVADPELGPDEQLGARDAARGDRRTDLALVEVRRRRVDHPVADAQRLLDGRLGLLGRRLEHAEPERRQLDAVVEGEGGLGVGGHGRTLQGRGRVGGAGGAAHEAPPTGTRLLMARRSSIAT
jgi:hypothetical protein